MFKFIHGYNERFLEGLDKRGFWNKQSGLKITQHFATPLNETFNFIAAQDGKLHRLVKENGYPLYIDRLQGGTFYQKYDFDRSLLREYIDRLGEWFLGIQMHEWPTVLNLDWKRIRTQLIGTPLPWTEQNIYDAIQAVSSCKWCIHLSSGTPYEYSRKQYSETWQEYLEEMRQLFRKRQDETGGFLLPCDSAAIATAMEYELGAHTVMPEVGSLTPLTRLQIGLARGMSEAFGKIWGAYYEPWGGKPLGACHFFDEPFNEWHMDNKIFAFDFSTHGANGGSSRALQRRIYYYCLMSGAHYLSEEWGMSNTFYNWTDYDLTPYGEIKKEFINFAKEHPEIKPFVPLAVVLPREFEVIDLKYLQDLNSETYLHRELDAETKSSFGHTKKVLHRIFARYGRTFGNEGHVITNSRFGDFFDLISEDSGEQVLSKYAYLVDASHDGGFYHSGAGGKHRVLDSADIDQLESSLHSIIESDLPCTVSAGVHWLISRSGEKWLLSIFNNEGVERSVDKGDAFIREADLKVTIHFKKKGKPRILKAWPQDATLELQDDGKYCCIVHAGGFFIIEFLP